MNKKWTIQKSMKLYLISRWGYPYFTINKYGNLACTPLGAESNISIDLKKLTDHLYKKGINPPFLLRFNDILHQQAKTIIDSFKNSIKIHKYKNQYQCIMPIKVNQQKHVIQELIKQKNLNIGLEVGSKPELLIAIAILKSENSILICNGYKDTNYIKMVLNTQKLFLKSYIVIDHFEELKYILKIALTMNHNSHPLIHQNYCSVNLITLKKRN